MHSNSQLENILVVVVSAAAASAAGDQTSFRSLTSSVPLALKPSHFIQLAESLRKVNLKMAMRIVR